MILNNEMLNFAGEASGVELGWYTVYIRCSLIGLKVFVVRSVYYVSGTLLDG